ncbi:MAG: hypothetical protein M0R33_00745 [Methylomonas sp.]|jgi:hypothetical protein|uniref:DUF6901 family protein n=1 Tax=Methylomonas sp. TaxID=418 RepID=UPI0025FE2952|nr:hypothetical protein [Methylomonas sp.]MCK9604962.1 hypothetical protein [Methylomonas sp.]
MMTLEHSDQSNWVFLYKLSFADDNRLEFSINIDKTSNSFIPSEQKPPPAWAALDYQQCSNCPLSKNEMPHCPVAANLVPLIELCGSMKSYQTLTLEVATPERTISGETTVRRAISSILGLIMATSACPHTEFFKPMARFHLPLASDEETIYRTTSMFLLAQYFLNKDGKSFTMELDQLTRIYKELQIINRALARRLRAAISEDAAVNGIILLDLLTQSVAWSIEDGLESIRYLFKRYGVE